MDHTSYTGIQELEILEEAVNYNRSLVDLICRSGASTQRVVDFGAGMGTLAGAVVERGFQVTCVEPDAELRGMLVRRGFRALENLDAIADESVDFIYSVNVLEHIKNDEATLVQLHRKLEPGGWLLLYVPAFPILYSGMDRRVGHVRRYGRSQLKRLVQRCGFAVERTLYADSLGFVTSLVYKLGGSRGLSRWSIRLYDRAVFPVSRLLDHLGLSRLLGKNLVIIAQRPVSELRAAGRQNHDKEA